MTKVCSPMQIDNAVYIYFKRGRSFNPTFPSFCCMAAAKVMG